jgi:short-subunit dehydrogenase
LVKQKSGHLVALTSVAGLRGGLDSPAYNASKAYQINYLQALQIKADRLQIPIFVTDVRPGYIDSNPDKIRSPWVIELEDAIQHIFIAIKKKKKIVYISKRWRCIGFILRIMTIFR